MLLKPVFLIQTLYLFVFFNWKIKFLTKKTLIALLKVLSIQNYFKVYQMHAGIKKNVKYLIVNDLV